MSTPIAELWEAWEDEDPLGDPITPVVGGTGQRRAVWPDPRSISVGFAFGQSQFQDPTTVTYETVSPVGDPDTTDAPGPVLDGFTIQRGRVGDAPETQATSIELVLRNDDGEFSPRNVSGPRYGTLRRGTWTRISIDVGSGPQPIATAAATGFTPTRTGPGIDPQVTVSGLGILNRLGRDTDRQPALRRYFGTVSPQPVAFWALDDPRGSQVAQPMVGDRAGLIAVQGRAEFGRPGPAGGTGAVRVVCGDAIVGPFSDNRPGLSLPVPAHTPGELVWSFWFRGSPFTEVPGADGSDASLAVASSWLNFGTDGTIGSITVNMTELVPGTNPLSSYIAVQPWTGLDGGGLALTELTTSPDGPQIFDGSWHEVQVRCAQVGGDVATELWLDGVQYGGATETTQTLGTATAVQLATSGSVFNAATSTDGGSTIFDVAAVAIFNDTAVPVDDLRQPGLAYAGELSGDRILRVFTEAGIISDNSGRGAAVGPQPPGTVLDVCRDAELADDGMLAERRGGTPWFFPTASLYNLPAELTLSFNDIPGAWINDDDRDIYNRITIVRQSDGAAATAELTTGPLGSSTSTGVGPRPISEQRNPAAEPRHLAGWLLHKSTFDKPRYTVIIDLTAEPDLASTVLRRDMFSPITVTDVPAEDDGPDDLDLVIVGETITYSGGRLLVQWDCEPVGPYSVGTYQNTGVLPSARPTRYSPSGSTTSASFTAGVDTSLSVASLPGPLWTTAAGNLPLYIRVAGAVLNVTAISGASSPQTFTVSATTVNGVTKTIPSGSAVELVDLGYYAL